jgi:hypothetical protein
VSILLPLAPTTYHSDVDVLEPLEQAAASRPIPAAAALAIHGVMVMLPF